MLLARDVLAQVFGQRLGPLVSGGALAAMRTMGQVGQALDGLLYPALAETPVRSPVSIIGAPRTGTTFLHRKLVELGVGQGQALWQMLAPALTLQGVLGPLVPHLEALSPARHHNAAAHETSLQAVETEDAALMFRYFDGLFAYAFLLAWAEPDLFGEIDPLRPGATARDLAFLERIWRRRTFDTGPGARVVAKAASLALRVPQILEKFPDARLIYTVRDPVEAIPSALSLVTSTIQARFGTDGSDLDPAAQARHRERIYGALVGLHEEFARAWSRPSFPRDRVLIVHHDSLVHDCDATMREVLHFVNHPIDNAVSTAIQETDRRQRERRSAHRYDLASFGLTADRIQRDCALSLSCFSFPDRAQGAAR